MGTTSLYVELIIIGLETIMWIASFSIFLTDIKYISIIKNIVETLPASIFLLGIMYILGLIFDRVTDLIFTKTENQIRNDSGLEAKSSILIWKECGQEEYFKFSRSKIRILRSSSINIPMFTISIILNIVKYYQSEYLLLLFVAIIGSALSYFSLAGYRQTITNFYVKARILEMALNQHTGNKQGGYYENDVR